MSQLQENFYGKSVYAIDKPLSFDEFQKLSINDLIKKMQNKDSDIINLLFINDDGQQTSVVISNNEILAQKMDIPFSLINNSLNLFEEPVSEFLIKDIMGNTLETTKKITINNNNFFSYTSVGSIASKVFQFVEDKASELMEEKQSKLKFN